jgi:hypothetical protein
VKRFTKRQLCIALYTASQWHGDTGQGPVAMLSLSSTRTVHNETHRHQLITEIKEDIYCLIDQGWGLDNDAFIEWKRDVSRLVDLWQIVDSCELGKEWLADRENQQLNDTLYDKGII